MEQKQYDIPILIICFKRYEKTLQIVNSIREVQPKKLYVAIDGNRNVQEWLEVEKVASIFNDKTIIDWDCEIKIKRSGYNQGCKYGVYNAIIWFFENEEMGIIIEDDIIPYKQFYPYCKELLEKYKDDKHIACISGWSYFYEKEPEDYEYTYYFSYVSSSWGWATWRDRWQKIDIEMIDNDFSVIESNLRNAGLSNQFINYYRWICQCRVAFNTTWDYQFCLSVLMKNNMYCIQPIRRFVKNIGTTDGTHPTNEDHNKSKIIDDDFVTINHPPFVQYNSQLDIIRNTQTGEIR